MTNIVQLHNEEQQALESLNQQIKDFKASIDDKHNEIAKLKDQLCDLEIKESSAEKGEVTKINKEIKQVKASIKKVKNAIDTDEELLGRVKVELGKILGKRKQQNKYESDKQTAERVFEENNIHYIAFDQQWWSVDPAGNRMSVKINGSEANVIRDLIFLDSDREITSEQELKVLAKEMNRMYKHMVRDFEKDRPGVYNQMKTIRDQWLKPIHGVTPHDSFRVLTLSISGGDEDYADQLEKTVAYRYLHPEDVMIPNIDSCAIGGTGRDTFWNIVRTIFTDECCGSVGTETFKGTHNGDLFGKMFVKIDEKDSYSVPIDKIKEFTGSTRYRHRSMGKDARDVARLFNFMMFRNGFTTTARLAGTGSSGEDRRWEPVIARVNLPRHLALYHGLITDLNQIPDEDTTKAMSMLIKDWQRDYYKNETRISEWLGHIIDKHKVKDMTELMPLHGKYYSEMLLRQKKGIDGFMPKFIKLMELGITNVINITQAHKIYQVTESVNCKKDWFKNEAMYWLNNHMGWDCEELTTDVYTWKGCPNNDRRKMNIIQNKLSIPEKLMFNLDDFIDREALDDKGTTVGEKINIFSIRDELR